jgi:hypothetical protein
MPMFYFHLYDDETIVDSEEPILTISEPLVLTPSEWYANSTPIAEASSRKTGQRGP